MSPDGPDPLGKRALFWAPATRTDTPFRPGEEGDDVGKYALFSRFSDDHEDVAEAPEPHRPPVTAGLLPPVEVHCSSCGTRSDVDVVRYLRLHVPFFLWRPGRGFTRFMVCPACHRRTWVSASWPTWSAR